MMLVFFIKVQKKVRKKEDTKSKKKDTAKYFCFCVNWKSFKQTSFVLGFFPFIDRLYLFLLVFKKTEELLSTKKKKDRIE
jgi:hypothetical protein